MGIAALICGILSAVAITYGWATMGITNLVFGIPAIILGNMAMKKGDPKANLAKIGMILGIIGAAFGALYLIGCIACMACGSASSSVSNY